MILNHTKDIPAGLLVVIRKCIVDDGSNERLQVHSEQDEGKLRLQLGRTSDKCVHVLIKQLHHVKEAGVYPTVDHLIVVTHTLHEVQLQFEPVACFLQAGDGVYIIGYIVFEAQVKGSAACLFKPVQEDASIGIDEDAVVKDMAALIKRINYVYKNYKQPAIVEEYIDGREFNISIIGNNSPRVLPVSEIDFSQISTHQPKICTYDAKWVTDSLIYLKTPPVCPADISEELEHKIFNIALKAYKVLGCRDYQTASSDKGIYIAESSLQNWRRQTAIFLTP